MKAAFALAFLALAHLSGPAAAHSRSRRAHPVCVPVFIEGAGTVRICPPIRRR